MHALEKILAKASGQAKVSTGEIVTAKVDFAEINDLYLQTVFSFWEMGGDKVWNKERLAFIFDHYAPCPTIKSAEIHDTMRDFAKDQGLKYHFDINDGVCHQVMPEAGVIAPGSVIIATDSHTTTHGAFGAFGTGVGATDMATIMITGEIWLRVPEIIEVRLEGQAPHGVYPKDVVLYVLGKIRADGAVYKAIDFTGSYVESLGVAGRMTICNMAVEMGAKTAYMQPNVQVLDYVAQRAVWPYQVMETDKDFKYSASYSFNVENLTPQISVPSSVENVVSIEEIGHVEVNQGFIGSCTGGRLEDIAVAADILKGKKLPKFSRLIVIPASREVLKNSIAKGYITQLIDAGATVSAPGCGPCPGTHQGVTAKGEVCITASNRNFPGRMGGGLLYLASPATVAASLLKGCITDVRTLRRDGNAD
ncbi:MAG: 3-isopropylmalate dehydratase large subunit [Clostridia bacterium]|nr:3-isopropylmalate dehydratase large subunit [Clostridia bacterium]